MRVGHADVIKREPHSELSQAMNRVQKRSRIRQRRLLGNLQDQPLRWNVRFRALSCEHVAESVAMRENVRMDIEEEQRPAHQARCRAHARSGARKLEVGDALFARRVLEQHFRIPK